MASVVVFLVALPLCIGLAIASGVPAERGLITGIVGGIVVGVITGSPLLVSGPAASLLVLVWDLVQTQGIAMLGPVVMGAGVVQMAAGLAGMGRWFRAVSPAVIKGMMGGIGVLIVASQLHVMLDAKPQSSLFTNLRLFPGVLLNALSTNRAVVAVGFGTAAIIVAWKRFRPKRLALVPPQLVAVAAVVLVCQGTRAKVKYLEVSGGLFEGLDFTGAADLAQLGAKGLIGQCLIFAFVASAATLLTATAIDQVQSEVQTDYDQELFAQGVGNSVAGWLGGLPMTGVIVRSSANVEAGATSRVSTILHGVWMLGFIALAPGVLALIPKASLGAILVVIGCTLAHPSKLLELDERDRTELWIGLITLGGVVGLDLFRGILLGLTASVLRLVRAFTRFDVRVEDPGGSRRDIYITGNATFFQLPRLAAALDAIPPGAEVHVHLDDLEYVDHACLEQLGATERRLRAGDGSLTVEWDELVRRYKEGPAPSAPAAKAGSFRGFFRAAQRILRGDEADLATAADHLQLTADRVFVDLPGRKLTAALDAMVPALTAGLGDDRPAAEAELRGPAAEQALHLGQGVVLIHASLPGVPEPRLAVARLAEPVDVETGRGDLLFILLDNADDPERHLLALGGLARACADPARLEAIRAAADAAGVRAAVEAGVAEAEAPRKGPAPIAAGSQLVVLDPRDHGDALAAALRRRFGEVSAIDAGGSTHRLLAAAAGMPDAGDLLILDVPPDDLATLDALITESDRGAGGEPARWRRLGVVAPTDG